MLRITLRSISGSSSRPLLTLLVFDGLGRPFAFGWLLQDCPEIAPSQVEEAWPAGTPSSRFVRGGGILLFPHPVGPRLPQLVLLHDCLAAPAAQFRAR